MKTIIFLVAVVITLFWMLPKWRMKPAERSRRVDVIVPAYNEEICITATVEMLMKNPYLRKIIVVNDGSTDNTRAVLDALLPKYDRLIALHQDNTGKGGALMNGVRHSEADYVLLTDADTLILPERDDIGYLLAEIDAGADAVGGIPASNLHGAGLLPYIRATVKLPMIVLKRTFQQISGGAPFLISGACGMFRREVLLDVPFSDRTKVEDLDLTWSLVTKGYKVRQSNHCIVYSQECNSIKSEWLRWKRWIKGYAVCMRLHKNLLLTRFGLFSILPMFVVVLFGIFATGLMMSRVLIGDNPELLPLILLFPLPWIIITFCVTAVSARHYRSFKILLLAPTAVFYLLLSYAVWIVHGFWSLLTGREAEQRDKPERYAHVVE